MDPVLVIFMLIALLMIVLFVVSLMLLLMKPVFKTANIVVSLLMMFISLFALSVFQFFIKQKQFGSALIAFFICAVYIVMPILLLTLKNPEEKDDTITNAQN